MKKLLALAIIIASIIACQKEISNTFITTPSTDKTSLQKFFADNKTKRDTFQCNAGAPIEITGKMGSVITFPSNAFVHQNGTPVSGTVSVEVLEIYTAADMIINNKPTASAGRPLSSGGEFLVQPRQDGELLKLAPGKQINILMKSVLPTAEMVGMQVFTGTDSIVGNDTLVNWTVDNSQNNSVRPRADSAGLFGYDLFASSVQWINCDRFINEPLISYSFDLSAAPTDSVVSLFVHITGRNSVLRVYQRDGDIFKSDNLIAAPVTIVALSEKNGQLYAAFLPVTLSDKGSSKLVFEPITEEALKQRLALLQ